MRKSVLFSGIGIFLAGAILVYISGRLTGPNSSELVYPSLFALQMLWTILAILGIIITIVGVVIKKKK